MQAIHLPKALETVIPMTGKSLQFSSPILNCHLAQKYTIITVEKKNKFKTSGTEGSENIESVNKKLLLLLLLLLLI